MSSWRRGCAVWVMCGLIAMAAAPDATARTTRAGNADQADVLFRLGNRHYRAGEYTRALSRYFASNRLAPNANVLVNIALCYQMLKRYVPAYRYYLAALKGKLTKQEKTAIRQALAAIAGDVSLVKVTSDPPGATIYLGRKNLGSRGVTPRLLVLKPGETIRLLLAAKNHDTAARTIPKLKRGDQIAIKVRLKAQTGRITFRGTPSHAKIRLSRLPKRTFRARKRPHKVPAGEHLITISAPGYLTKKLTARLLAEALLKLGYRLERATGRLIIHADERDATVKLDGQVVGFTPLVLPRVPVGRHVVTVVKLGFVPARRQILVKPRAGMQLKFKLPAVTRVQGASRVSESVLTAPASVSVITPMELRAFGYLSLADAISGERGIFTTDDRMYASSGIRTRDGFGQYGNRTLVTLDGHVMNESWVGSSFIGYELLTTLHAIRRIEIIRGPGSALYGNAAYYGVYNLVTRRAFHRRETRFGLSVAGVGQFRLFADFATPFGDGGGLHVYAGGFFRQPGTYFSRQRAEANMDPVAHDVNGESAGTFLAKAKLGDWKLLAYYQQRHRQIGTGVFETLFGDDRSFALDRRSFLDLRWEPTLSPKLRLNTRLTLDHTSYQGDFYSAPPYGLYRDVFRGNTLGADVRVHWKPLERLKLTFGIDHRFHFDNHAVVRKVTLDEEVMDERNPYHNFAVFMLVDLKLFPWWGISVNLRLDKRFVTGGNGPLAERTWPVWANPRVAMRFHPVKEGTLKLLFGRAFRSPSIYELTYNDGGHTQISSPNLEPEKLLAGEISYTHKLPKGFWVTGGVFFYHSSDTIYQGLSTAPDPVDRLQYRNSTVPVQVLGAEFEVRKVFRRGWMFMAQYSYQRTRRKSVWSEDGVSNAPEHLAGIKLVMPLYRHFVRLATRVAIVGPRFTRDLSMKTKTAVVWDLILSGENPAMKLKYSVGIRNLMNWSYNHPLGDEAIDQLMPQPGLSAVADLQFAF